MAAMDIAPDRLGKGGIVAGDKRGVIGGRAAIEALCHLLDALGDGEIADAEFAQAVVHVGKEDVENGLSTGGGGLARVLQAVEHEEDVQHQEVEATLDRVGNAETGVECRQTRLLDEPDIDVAGGGVGGFAAEQAGEHIAAGMLVFSVAPSGVLDSALSPIAGSGKSQAAARTATVPARRRDGRTAERKGKAFWPMVGMAFRPRARAESQRGEPGDGRCRSRLEEADQ